MITKVSFSYLTFYKMDTIPLLSDIIISRCPRSDSSRLVFNATLHTYNALPYPCRLYIFGIPYVSQIHSYPRYIYNHI